MDFLGYAGFTFWENLGTYRYILTAYAALLSLLLVLKVFTTSICKRMIFINFYNWLSRMLLWNCAIYVVMLGCMQFFMSAFNQISQGSQSDQGSFLLAFLILMIILAFMCASYFIVRRFHDQLETVEFEKKFGALTRDLRKSSTVCLYYPIFFVLKRAITAYIIVKGGFFA